MRKKVTILSAMALCLGAAAFAEAQQAMLTPPKVLVIIREVLKPGKGPAHEKWETGWPRAFAKAKWPTNYLAVTAMTGEPRALFFTGYDSLAAWESNNQALEKNAALSAEDQALGEKDGDYLKEMQTGVFNYMPELSYQPDVPVAGVRYFLLAAFDVKQGHGDQFIAARKVALAAHQKGGLSDHFSLYHRTAGGSTNLYLIFIPMKSLAEVDQFAVIHGAPYQAALGADGQKTLADLNSQDLVGTETQIFAFSPKMSYVSKEWVASEPAFWAPKPAPAAKSAAMSAEKPAAKKEAKKP